MLPNHPLERKLKLLSGPVSVAHWCGLKIFSGLDGTEIPTLGSFADVEKFLNQLQITRGKIHWC